MERIAFRLHGDFTDIYRVLGDVGVALTIEAEQVLLDWIPVKNWLVCVPAKCDIEISKI